MSSVLTDPDYSSTISDLHKTEIMMLQEADADQIVSFILQ